MKNFSFKITLLVFIASLALGSCSRDNSVVSNNRIQKRKYNSGFHIDKNKKFKTVKDKNKIDRLEIAAEENKTIDEKTLPVEKFEVINSSAIAEVQSEHVKEPFESSQDMVISTNALPHFQQKEENNLANPFLERRTVKKQNSNETVIRNLVHKTHKKKSKKKSMRIDSIVYILLCIFLPGIAVGLATNWDPAKTLIGILLWILFWIPGIIYAFYICDQQGVL